jgi:dolichol-phosphate hexosyltransferase
MDKPELSVLVATFNEQESIAECLRRIFAVYPQNCEVLVIDGGTDRTGEIVRGLCGTYDGLRYVRNEDDRGKGHATRAGIGHARADVMMEIDADLQFLPEELPRLVAPILENRADVCLGSRFASESTHNYRSFVRSMGNGIVSLYASLLYGHRMTDVLAGMTAWHRRVMDAIELVSDNHSYAVEIPVRALQRGFQVVDVPVTTEPRRAGQSKVNVVRHGLEILRDTTLFRLGLK